MSSSDNDDRDSGSVATDEAVAVIVAPNPAPGTTEKPANVAPDVARPHTNIAELNSVPNANTPSDKDLLVSTRAGGGSDFEIVNYILYLKIDSAL